MKLFWEKQKKEKILLYKIRDVAHSELGQRMQLGCEIIFSLLRDTFEI